jgi:hypothetical protein
MRTKSLCDRRPPQVSANSKNAKLRPYGAQLCIFGINYVHSYQISKEIEKFYGQ